MTDPNRDVLRDHEFDGIREYDNPTPGWWYVIFLATVIFSVWYFLFYHASTISSSVAGNFEDNVAADLKRRFSEIGTLTADRETMLRFLDEEEWLKVGASVFQAQCISCHGQEGEGLIGPNLTDDYYKNVRKIEDMAEVVSNGAANGAMPAWKTRLHPNEVVLVSVYAASLRGRNLTGPRGPEGEEIPPWPEPEPEPSTTEGTGEEAPQETSADTSAEASAETAEASKKSPENDP